MGTQPSRLFPCICPGLKKDYGGKRCVFNEERNKGKVGQDRSGKGRELQMDEAANEKETNFSTISHQTQQIFSSEGKVLKFCFQGTKFILAPRN